MKNSYHDSLIRNVNLPGDWNMERENTQTPN